MMTRFQSPGTIACTVLVAFVGLGLTTGGASPVHAEAISWRHVHAMDRDEADGTILRRGVAIFHLGSHLPVPATLEVRSRLGLWEQGWQTYTSDWTYRFDDGAIVRAKVDGRQQRDPATNTTGPQEGKGEFVSGTGRFEGIRGTFSGTGRAGLSAATPGVLADIFGDFTGNYTLPAR
jgi:hypothetical protein